MTLNLKHINFRNPTIRRGNNRLRVIVSAVAWLIAIICLSQTTTNIRTRGGGFQTIPFHEAFLSATMIAVGVYLFMLALYWGTYWVIQGFRLSPKKPSSNKEPREIEYTLQITDHSSYRPRILHTAVFQANTMNDHEQAKSHIIYHELEPLIPVGQWANQWENTETGLVSWYNDLCIELHTDLPESDSPPTTSPPITPCFF